MGPLATTTARVTGDGPASAYAKRLLGALGASLNGGGGAELVVDPGGHDSSAEWARCGGMWLTGEPEGPPQPEPGSQAASLHGAAAVASALASKLGASLALDGPSLVGERAALLGLSRHGTTSSGGASRLMPAFDRWVAMTLARAADVDLLAAWLGHEWHGDPWHAVAGVLRSMPAIDAVARAQLLGIPAAVAVAPYDTPAPFRLEPTRRSRSERWPPFVVDVSSLWAGPVCTRLLRDTGARVIKVESVRRPDGTRDGPAAFFDLMHAGKESVALDFATDAGRSALHALIAAADVVVESSRPRALEQLGIDASSHDGVWVSITGYGRDGLLRNHVAFGDDAAVAGGIAAATGEPDGPPLFCGDAYADPVAGLHAAIAALACLVRGGGWLVDVAMRDVVACLLWDAPITRLGAAGRVERDGDGWAALTDVGRVTVTPPPVPSPRGRGPRLGEHTDAVIGELGSAA